MQVCFAVFDHGHHALTQTKYRSSRLGLVEKHFVPPEGLMGYFPSFEFMLF